jgi:hypothetical protein
MSKKHIIFSDLSGHRIHWLKMILDSSIQPSQFILHFPDSNMNSVMNQLKSFEVSCEVKFHPAAQFVQLVIKSIASEDRLIDWDADTRIHQYLFTKKKIKVLVMRPYLQEKSFLSVCKYSWKVLMLALLSFKKNFDFYLLAIPGHYPRIFRHQWVNDYVDLTKVSTAVDCSLEHQNYPVIEELPGKYFLVPGFITDRKNPILILNAVRIFNLTLKENFMVVFAGEIQSSLREKIEYFPESKIIGRSLTEGEIDELIDHCSATLLLYENVSSSGFALRSLSRSRVTILTKYRHWFRISNQFQSFLQVSQLNHIDLSTLLINLAPFDYSQEETNSIKSLNQNNLGYFLNQENDVLDVLQ